MYLKDNSVLKLKTCNDINGVVQDVDDYLDGEFYDVVTDDVTNVVNDVDNEVVHDVVLIVHSCGPCLLRAL